MSERHQPTSLLSRLDRRVERMVAFRPRGRDATRWRIVVGLLLALATAVRAGLGTAPVADLFVLPVLVSVFVLRKQGLVVLPLALVLYHLSTVAGGDLSLRMVLVNDLVELSEWCLLSLFVLVTLEKFAAVKRLQIRIHEDLEMARALQSSLISRDYDFGGVRIFGVISQSSLVGGDFYYFRPFQKKYVVFCLGDVMGKGISASMIMAMVMGFMFEWGKKSPSPEFVLAKLNHRLARFFERQGNLFVTLFYAVFNEETGELVYACGGHHGGVILRADGRVEQLDAEGIPLGIFPDTHYRARRERLGAGDRVVLFTDGVTEARSANGSLFGVERLLELLGSLQHVPSQQLVTAVRQSAVDHAEGELDDDIAVLAMEVKPNWTPAAT